MPATEDGAAAPSVAPLSLVARGRTLLERGLEGVVLTLMAALPIVVVVGVTFRKFGESLVWYDEVASVLLAWLTFYGAALAALRRAHIGVPTLVRKLPPRLGIAAVLLAESLVVAFFLVVAWAGLRVVQVLAGTTLISLPWVPTALTQSVIPIGALLFVACSLLSLPEALAQVGNPGPSVDGDGELGAPP